MGVYIKGMKMPRVCGECKMHFLGYPDYVCCGITDRIPKIVGKYHNSKIDLDAREKSILSVMRPDWCPLVEVEEHGDLVDREEIKNVIREEDWYMYSYLDDSDYKKGVSEGYNLALECIDMARVVIRREGSEEET